MRTYTLNPQRNAQRDIAEAEPSEPVYKAILPVQFACNRPAAATSSIRRPALACAALLVIHTPLSAPALMSVLYLYPLAPCLESARSRCAKLQRPVCSKVVTYQVKFCHPARLQKSFVIPVTTVHVHRLVANDSAVCSSTLLLTKIEAFKLRHCRATLPPSFNQHGAPSSKFLQQPLSLHHVLTAPASLCICLLPLTRTQAT